MKRIFIIISILAVFTQCASKKKAHCDAYGKLEKKVVEQAESGFVL